MKDDWDYYALRVDDQPASTFVNLTLAQLAPIISAPIMANVSVQMHAPRPDGLSSQDEFDDLIALERSVEARIKAETGAVYGGRCTTAGRRVFYFYIADRTMFESAAAGALADHPAYAYSAGHRSDPEWSVYREFLHPDARDMQRIKNRRVIAALEEHGDYPDIPRWIDHRAYMPTDESADLLRTRLLGAGFSVEVQADALHKDVAVDFKRIDRPREIELTVIPIVELVRSLGGTYDGWGCEVESGSA